MFWEVRGQIHWERYTSFCYTAFCYTLCFVGLEEMKPKKPCYQEMVVYLYASLTTDFCEGTEDLTPCA